MTPAYALPIGPEATALGTAVGTFTTFQSITSGYPNRTLFGGELEIGSVIELEAEGEFSTTGTPTLSIGFWYGTAAVVLAASSALTTASAAAQFPWHVKYRGKVTALGTAGSITGLGFLDLGTSLTAFATGVPIPITVGARTVTIDTTVNKELGVGAAWGTSSASNTVRVLNFTALRLA